MFENVIKKGIDKMDEAFYTEEEQAKDHLETLNTTGNNQIRRMQAENRFIPKMQICRMIMRAGFMVPMIILLIGLVIDTLIGLFTNNIPVVELSVEVLDSYKSLIMIPMGFLFGADFTIDVIKKIHSNKKEIGGHKK